MKKYISSMKVLILALLLAVGGSYLFAWTGPTTTPPGGNVPAPINVGASTQAKTGLLGLSALQFNPNGSSNVASGSVMVATDAFGDVAWEVTSTSTTATTTYSFNNFQVFNSSGSFTVPSGISNVMIEVWGAGGTGGGVEDYIGAGGGGYGKGIFTVSPGTVYTVTVGRAPGELGNGGTSSFGSLISATGGTSGGVGGVSTASININGTSADSCAGGASANGGGGGTPVVTISGGSSEGGSNGQAPGGGGSCASEGANGRVIVWW